PQELLNHANDLGYPCLIKPARFAFQALGWKATVCTGPEMVQQFANTWPTSVEAMLVQQLLRGWRYNCQFVARQGDLLTYFEHLVIRTDRFDGTGLVVESSSVAPTPEHFHATRALARELRYTGPGCLQVLRDPASDTWGVLELNPRLAASCGFPLACGVNLMALAIDAVDPASRTANPLRDLSDVTYRPGVRLDWLGGDLRGL
ncbi:MAG: hypothetical protein GTO41_08965, partial [Burkholderiales bacterium]|nr:hypothetical protein [Burkholderiales bacterium]